MKNKIKVYKDSNGNLHENYDDFCVKEVKLRHYSHKKLLKHWSEIIDSDEEAYYKMMKSLRNSLLKMSDKKFEKEYNENIDFIKQAKKIQNKRNGSDYTMDNYDYGQSTCPVDYQGMGPEDFGIELWGN